MLRVEADFGATLIKAKIADGRTSKSGKRGEIRRA
jgi:hypothetical protein